MGFRDKKISEMPLASPITGSEKLHVVQDAINKQSTVSKILELIPQLEGEPNGFIDPSQVNLAFDEGTRTLTVSPTDTFFEFYSDGVKFTKTTPQTVVLPDVEGLGIAYFDEAGTLTSQPGFDPIFITRYCLVASGYWDFTNKTTVPNAWCELHGSSMSPATHAYLHRTMGVQWVSGISLEVTTGDSTDLGNQIASSAGVTADEDLNLSILAQAKGNTIPVLYKSGASGVWRADKTRLYPFLNTGTGRVAWNQFTGGSWQLTEATNGDFVLAHIYAIPGINQDEGRLIAIPGQNQYLNRSDAQDAALYEALQLDLTGLPGPEFLLVGSLIIQTRDNYGIQKARFSPTLDDKTYIDWRGNKSASSAGATTTASWGSITGTLSDQIDLQAALNAKVSDGDPITELSETATAKIMTGDERTKLAGLNATDYATAAQGVKADTAAQYSDETANFTGSLQQNGDPVVTQKLLDSRLYQEEMFILGF